ncbi:MAG: DUF4157 domain-containing protein [Gammaproteobacteria bacterium]|nr:DUF4157 domain-containing protein [Gammaproteobacteria bacterium]
MNRVFQSGPERQFTLDTGRSVAQRLHARNVSPAVGEENRGYGTDFTAGHRFENFSVAAPVLAPCCGCASAVSGASGLAQQYTTQRPLQTPSSAPLPSTVRSVLEPRLGCSLASIRLHADDAAAKRAKQRGALAFTTGRHIYFNKGVYQPSTLVGDWILGHEATHAVQQGLADVTENGNPNVVDTSSETQANRIASGHITRVSNVHPPAAMLLTPAQFISQLGSTPAQAFAINTLFANPSFLSIWNWLRGCTVNPAQDLGPLALRVTPGLVSGGAVRFGGYSRFSRTLEINPTKPEHVENPAEMVDTIFHELIHAADDLSALCQTTGSVAAPLRGAATSTLSSRTTVAGTLQETLFNIAQGPGASDPCGEFIDINAAAQTLVTDAIQSNIQIAGVGQPTLTFVNMIIRQDPAALTAYENCRRRACGLGGSARSRALSACSRETIAQFLPTSMLSSLLPAQIQFDFAATHLRADQISKLDLIARYLMLHVTQMVEIVGHTDKVGGATSNLLLGQQRADSVRAALLARGVAATQIRRTRSAGETSTISSSSSERWRDRRVEILL